MDYYIPKMFFVAYFFFFQAEDGIRDGHVTGVQTCALPIYQDEDFIERGVQFIPDGWTRNDMFDFAEKNLRLADAYMEDIKNRKILLFCKIPLRSEERRVGKECRFWCCRTHENKKNNQELYKLYIIL